MIAIIYTSVFPPSGGYAASDRRVRDISRGLTDANQKNCIFVPRYRQPKNVGLGQIGCETLYLGSIFDRIPVLNRIAFWTVVVLNARQLGVSTVLYYSPTIDCLISQIPLRLLGVCTVVEISDLVSHNFPRTFVGFLFWLGERVPPRIASVVLPISKFIERDVLPPRLRGKSHVIPVLVDTDDFVPNENLRIDFRKRHNIVDSCVVIGYSGGMYESYGVDNLIHAFSKLVGQSSINCKLVLAGRIEKHPNSVDVSKLVNDLGLTGNVILTGWVTTNEIKSVLNGCDVLVIPHEPTTANRAGLPTKIAEYAAMAKPIVSTKVGEIDSYFVDRENIVFSEQATPDGIFQSLYWVIQNKAIFSKLGTGAFSVAIKFFCFRKNGKILAKILNAVHV